MRLFRRSVDLSQATVRLSQEFDARRLARLFRDATQRYYSLSAGDLPGLLAAAYGVILEVDDELCGAVVVGWPSRQTVWLRGVVLADGIPTSEGLHRLLASLHPELCVRGIRRVFFAGDEASDIWLTPRLRRQGYVPDTEVVVYEKRSLNVPAQGNLEVQVRTAYPGDLRSLFQLDQACFEDQWTKDELMLHAAIEQGPLCLIAELNEQVVGYVYATSHFGDRLIHLVRIAVDPRFQGQAIGVRLLREVVVFARRIHADMVTLNTQLYNTQAQRLYHWFGFQLTGDRQVVLRYDLSKTHNGQHKEDVTCLPE